MLPRTAFIRAVCEALILLVIVCLSVSCEKTTAPADVSIELTVVDLYENPVPRAVVSLEPGEWQQTVGAEGRAVFRGLAAGEYTYHITAAYFADVTSSITVETDQPSRLTVKLVRTAVPVAVWARDPIGFPIVGARVVLSPVDSVQTAGVDGMVRFDDIEVGEYSLAITATGFADTVFSVILEPDRGSSFYIYCRRQGQIIPYARYGAAGGVIDNRFYVVGGGVSSGPSSSRDATLLDVYDPLSDTWEARADPPEDIVGRAAGIIDGVLYVVTRDYSPEQYLLIYDPVPDRWSYGAPVPTARYHFMVGVIDQKLYLVGGLERGTSEHLSLLEIYNPDTDSWSTAAPMLDPIYNGVSGVIDGKLYIAGATGLDQQGHYDSVGYLQVYDPESDAWSRIASMPTPRSGACAAVVDGRLYVIGGYDDTALNVVEAYDPLLDSWTTLSPMNAARSGSVAGVLLGSIYVFGGGNDAEDFNTFEIITP